MWRKGIYKPSNSALGALMQQKGKTDKVTLEDLGIFEETYVEIAKMLVQSGAEIHIIDDNGKSCLDVAIDAAKTRERSERLISALEDLSKE